MDDKQIIKLINDEINKNTLKNVYNVSPIPIHSHTGTDSVRVNATDLVDSSSYFAISRTILSSSNILALNTAPITIVSAFGGSTSGTNSLNSVIIVEGITAKIYAGSTAYTGLNNLEFRYTNASGVKVTADIANTFINTTANTTAYAHAPQVTTSFTPVFNSPIIVTVPVANPAAGNGRIVILVKYRIVSI